MGANEEEAHMEWRMPALARAFAPEAQGWLELWAIWHGWCRNEGAISLQYASEISSRYPALYKRYHTLAPYTSTSQERSGKSEERSASLTSYPCPIAQTLLLVRPDYCFTLPPYTVHLFMQPVNTVLPYTWTIYLSVCPF